jgi:hypothetical protein
MGLIVKLAGIVPVETEGLLNGLLIQEGLATAGKTDDRSPEVSPKISPASQNWGSWV